MYLHKLKTGTLGLTCAAILGLMAIFSPATVMAADAPAQQTDAPAQQTEETAKEEKAEEKSEDKDKKDEKKSEEKKDESKAEDKEKEAAPKPQEEGEAQTSMADALHADQTVLAETSVYQVRIGYEFEDGSYDEWARGTALLAGEKYLITRQGLADTSAESALFAKIREARGENYERIGIYFGNAAEIQKHIKVRVAGTEGPVDIAEIKIKNGIALLTMRVKPNSPTCVFAEISSPKAIEGSHVGIMAAGNLDDKCEVKKYEGDIIPAPEDKEGLFLNADMTGVSALGGIMFNGSGQVVGMIAGEGAEKPCFTVSALQTILTSNGVKFRTAAEIQKKTDDIEQQDISDSITASEDAAPKADKTGLQESITQAESLKKGRYTEATYTAMASALEEAKKANENSVATQAEINIAKKNLDDAMGAMEEKKFPINISMLAKLIGLLGVIAILATVIKNTTGTGRRKEEPSRDDDMPKKKRPGKEKARKAPARDTEYDSDDYYDDDDLDLTKRTRSKKARISYEDRDRSLEYADDKDDDSRVTDFDRDGKDGTMLLNTGVHLVRKDNGMTIPIRKTPFLIGKEIDKVDYPIMGNSTISRIHAKITVDNEGEYYIEDQQSTNYTYVNGHQIPAYTKTRLRDGMTVMLSDVEMVFKTK